MPGLRRLVRSAAVVLAAVLAAVLGAIVLAVVGAGVLLQTERGRAEVARAVERLASTPGALEVRIGGIGRGLPSRLVVDDITLADADGVWLAARGLRFAWRPLALLSGEVRVEDLSLAELDIRRSPAAADTPEAATPEEPFEIPRLPVSVRIDRFGIGSLRLEAPVLGQRAIFAVDGRLAAEEAGHVRTQLAIERRDGRDGSIRLAADLDRAARALAIDGSVREPADGLLLALLGTPERPPLAVTLAGSGPLADWRGALEADAAGVARGRADLTFQAEQEQRFAASGTADFQADPLPVLHPALARGLAFTLALRRPAGDTLVLETLKLDGSGLGLAGSGRLDLAASELQVVLDLSLAEAALAPGALGPAGFETARATATIAGPVSAPAIEAAGAIEGLRAPGLRARTAEWRARSATGDGPADAEQIALSADGRLLGLAFDDALLRDTLGDTATFALDARLDTRDGLLTLRSSSLAAGPVRLGAAGTLGLDSGALNARADLELADLRPVGRAAGLATAGSAGLGARLGGTLSPLAIDGAADARAARLATGVPAADVLLGPEPRAEAGFSYAERSGLDVRRLQVFARNLSAEGTASLSADFSRLDARLRADVPSLASLSSPLGTDLRGALLVEATASGTTADPSATLSARLREAKIAGFGVAEAHAELRAATLASRPAGRLTADAASDLGPVTAAADFAMLPNGVLRVSPLSATAAGLRLAGDLEATPATGLVDGRLLVRSDEPAAGIRAGALTITGPARLDLHLAPAAGRQSIDGSLQAGPLVVRDGADEQGGVGSLSGIFAVADAFRAPSLRAGLRGQQAAFGTLRLASVAADVDGTARSARIGVSATGAGASPDTLAAGGTLIAGGEAIAVDLDRLDGSLGGEKLALQRPARFTSAPGRLQVSGFALSVGDGRLVADALVRPGETTAAVQATALPAGLARTLSSAAPVAGLLDLDVSVRTQGGDAAADAELRLRRLRWGDGSGGGLDAAILDGRAGIRLADGRALLDARLEGPEGSRADLSASAPVRLPAGTTGTVVDRAAPVSGTLSLDADLGKLSRLLAFSDQRVEGTLQGDVRLAGSLAAPRLQGQVAVEKGLYENFVTGTLFQDLAIRLEAAEARTLALRLTGTDGGSGRIAANGRAGLDEAGALSAEGSLDATDATLIRRDDVTATTSAALTFAGTGDTARLAGRIETSSIEVRLVERLPPSVMELPVREIERDAPAAPGDPADRADGLAVALDLSVSMPRRVFVRGRGLESEWSGALTVAGTTAAPRVAGTVELVRGTFAFAGKHFTLQRGTIGFSGGERIDPLINAVAEYRAADITALISITGLASHPEIEITSQPPLPESEVLAQVLFGKSSAKLGPVEAVQLAAAIDTLARGESMSEDVFSFARTLLGLDTLSVQPGSTGDQGTSLAVGRYVGDRIYIGAEQGIDTGAQTGTVEVEIAPGISVESEIGQSATTGTQGALGLKFKWDY